MSFPKFAEFREEGPREGFQIKKQIYATELRAKFVDLLSETGLKRITRKPGVHYTSLRQREKSFRKAMSIEEVDIAPPPTSVLCLRQIIAAQQQLWCRREARPDMGGTLDLRAHLPIETWADGPGTRRTDNVK